MKLFIKSELSKSQNVNEKMLDYNKNQSKEERPIINNNESNSNKTP